MWDKMSMKRAGLWKKAFGGVALALALVVAGPVSGMHTQANSDVKNEQNAAFEIEADVLRSDQDTYNIQVNVKNNGADWDGIVRVFAQEDYSISSYYSGRTPNVYDTVLSLPQSSEKQFVVKIPKGSGEREGSNIRVALIDKKSKVVTEKMFSRLLLDDMESIALGILSDEYADLTYLDMGGSTMYYYNAQMPIKLVDMTKSKLTEALDGLTILVISEYNTDVLTDEEAEALALWIDNGGVLIVDTGAAAKETLSGLEDVIPEVECLGVSQSDGGAGAQYDNYSSLNTTVLRMANLQGKSSQYYENYFSYGLVASVGDGAVGILPFSLVELSRLSDIALNDMSQEQYVMNMLEEFSSSSNARYNKTNNSISNEENLGQMQRLMGILGNANTTLNFGILKLLVVLYVIFVGPVLYLILRATRKREWYWVCVPVAAVVGILVVFLAGRGFEVASTRMYSVTTEDLSGKQNSKSYLYGYDANFKEWSLQMAEGYEYAGSLDMDNYYYTENIDSTEYFYRVQNEGGRLSIGVKPRSAFEDSFFYAGKANGEASDSGTLEVSDIKTSWSTLEGVVTNNTNLNLEYFAVIINGDMYVYKNLPAGGKFSLGKTNPIFRSSSGNDLRREYINQFLRDIHDGDIKEDLELTAALGIGLKDACPQSDSNKVVVCGVTKNWDKTIDDNCNETSYGCIYMVQ